MADLHTDFRVPELFRLDVLLILINGINILPNNFNYFVYLDDFCRIICASSFNTFLLKGAGVFFNFLTVVAII